jgi:hypothetical protein
MRINVVEKATYMGICYAKLKLRQFRFYHWHIVAACYSSTFRVVRGIKGGGTVLRCWWMFGRSLQMANKTIKYYPHHLVMLCDIFQALELLPSLQLSGLGLVKSYCGDMHEIYQVEAACVPIQLAHHVEGRELPCA